MNSFVLGSDKTFFDGLDKIEQYNFFSDCYKFFTGRYGEENVIAAVVHNDETTPQQERKKNWKSIQRKSKLRKNESKGWIKSSKAFTKIKSKVKFPKSDT